MDGDAPELKAGHPPAVKVGGMRVVQKKDNKEEKPEPPKMTAEDKEEFGEDKPEKKGAAASAMVVSGAKATEDQAYPKEAVKSFHEKPIPSHVNKMPGHSTKPNIIQQPKK